ncbi:CsiV family protein [Microbulbifer sediminum]|uniref:CsiV family protein n=1 Tax=Microbulbifer sediminum TaxID=2904250 RepID=UPI001F41B8D9|nr:CsiV family protein [Microbulbifer sediminum]
MTRFLKLCSALLMVLSATSTQAASYAGTTFEIEMIVFSRTAGMDGAREDWPAAPRLSYPGRWIDFSSTGDDGAPLLDQVPTQLDNKAAALKRSSSYRVLFHKAWQQRLWQKRRAPSILVSGGETNGRHSELEGTIKVSVSRYLHLSTNLWMSEFASPAMDGRGILLPTPSRQQDDEPLELSAGPAGTSGAMRLRADAPVYAAHVAQLQQERRMRSGELHYLDHPLFGVLIQVRKVEKPGESG